MSFTLYQYIGILVANLADKAKTEKCVLIEDDCFIDMSNCFERKDYHYCQRQVRDAQITDEMRKQAFYTIMTDNEDVSNLTTNGKLYLVAIKIFQKLIEAGYNVEKTYDIWIGRNEWYASRFNRTFAELVMLERLYIYRSLQKAFEGFLSKNNNCKKVVDATSRFGKHAYEVIITPLLDNDISILINAEIEDEHYTCYEKSTENDSILKKYKLI